MFYSFQKSTNDQNDYWKVRDDILQANIHRIYYDSIILLAMALNKSVDDLKLLNPPRKLEDFNYHDKEMADIFNYNARHMEFTSFSVSRMYYLINLHPGNFIMVLKETWLILFAPIIFLCISVKKTKTKTKKKKKTVSELQIIIRAWLEGPPWSPGAGLADKILE